MNWERNIPKVFAIFGSIFIQLFIRYVKYLGLICISIFIAPQK